MNTINQTQLRHTNLHFLFDEYLIECKYSKYLSPQTLKGYKEVFCTFQKVLPEVKHVEDLYPHLISEFFRRLSTRKRIIGRDTIKIGVKSSTIKTYYNKLIAFFKWLERYGYIEKDSLSSKIIKPPEPIYDDQKALSESEVSKIISAIALYTIKDPFMYKRDILIVSLLLYTGIRKGELLGIRLQDINLQERTLRINGKTSKSKKSRFIPLHYTLITHLNGYLKERKNRKTHCDALIISIRKDTALTHYGLKHWVNKYKKLSNVPFHIHRFRHTFACSLAKENADLISIMNVMGHTTTRMTERYLRSITSENSRSFIEKISY